MARFDINPGLDEWMNELSRFGADESEIAREVVMEGAQPIADGIRDGIKSLPVDQFRRLKENEEFSVLTNDQKEDLLESLGITPPGIDNEGNTNVKVGFDGYGRHKTRKYPKGLPNALLARAVESGSSVRKKRPFVRPATNKYRSIAIVKMQNKINEKITQYHI